MFNDSLFNTTLFNAEPADAGPLSVELIIEQVSEQAIGKAEILIKQYSYELGTPELTIEQTSIQTAIYAALIIAQNSYTKGASELDIRQISTNSVDTFDDATGWTLTLIVDGVDYSHLLIGDWSVDAEEGMSKIATVKMMPWTVGFDVLEYVRKPVELYFNYHYAGASTPVSHQIFSGLVLEPRFDLNERLIELKCSDMMQEKMNQLTLDELIAEIGGEYSIPLYGEDNTGWDIAQALMLSQSGSYDFDGSSTGHFSIWNNRSATLHEFDSSSVIEGTINLELANSRNIKSSVEIDFDYRFTRKRYRSYYYTWTMSPPVGCEFLNNPFQLPQRSMIQSACEGASWTLEGLSFIDLPKPQAFECQRGGSDYILPWGFLIINNSLVPDPDIELLCQGFHAKFSKKWAQTVTENYSITIDVINSDIGTTTTVSSGLETKFDEDSFEADSGVTDRHFSSAVSSATGDLIKDIDDETDIDRTEVNNAISALTAIEKGKLLNSYRENYVSFSVLLNPEIERHHRGYILLSDLEAEGKIYQYVHRGNISVGNAETEITLSLFRTGASSSENVGDEYVIGEITKPDSDIVPSQQNETTTFGYGTNSTHIGGSVASPPLNDAWTGYFTNYGFDEFNNQPHNPDAPTAEMYPVKFVLPTPGIESELRQSIDVSASPQKIELTIPTDTLVYA